MRWIPVCRLPSTRPRRLAAVLGLTAAVTAGPWAASAWADS